MSQDETAILACILDKPSYTIPLLAESGLTGDDFATETNKDLFNALLSLPLKALEEIDYYAIQDAIPPVALNEIGGMVGLLRYTDNYWGFRDIIGACERVKVASKLRTFRGALQSATNVLDSGQGVQMAVATIEPAVRNVDALAPKAGMEVKEWIGQVIQAAEESRPKLGILTGVFELNYYVNRLSGGELFLLAARPGVGKTSLAGQIAMATADAGHRVVFYSAEMTGGALAQRWCLSEAGISLDDFDAKNYDPSKLFDAHERMSKRSIRLEEVGRRTLPEIMLQMRREAAGGTKLFIFDYLQLLDPGLGSKATAYERVSAVSRLLTQIAIETKTCVLALAQLNRQLDSNGVAREPRLSDLRESGQLEQDADLVFMLHKVDGDKTGEVTCFVRKNRSGPTGSARLYFNGALSRFDDWEGPGIELPDELATF